MLVAIPGGTASGVSLIDCARATGIVAVVVVTVMFAPAVVGVIAGATVVVVVVCISV